MHGLIFAGFSNFIHARYPDFAAEIWESEPSYDPAEAYSDDDFTRILTRTIERTGDGSREILLEFGRFAAQNTFFELYPAYYDASGSTQQFLLGVETRIHELVRATVRGTAPPRLQVSRWVKAYRSATPRSGDCAICSKGSCSGLRAAMRRRMRPIRCCACTVGIPRASSTRLPSAERFVQRFQA
jgi:hypothetical protein